MIKAVIFDRDGVLVDTEVVHLDSVRTALIEMGFKLSAKDEALVIGKNRVDYKDDFLRKYPVNWDEFVLHQRAAYSRLNNPKKQVISQAVSLVLELKKRKFKLALVTSASRKSTDEILKTIGLENIFEVILAFEDCTARKPSPQPYLLVAKKLGVLEKDCLVIEDTPVGVISAKDAGMKCIAVNANFLPEQDYSKADLVLERNDLDYERIKNIIGV